MHLFLPLLDGTDRVGVMAFTADRWDDDDRRLGRRFAGLLAEVLRMTQYSQFAPRQPWPTTYPRSDERPDPGRRLVEGRSAVRSGRPASTRQIDGYSLTRDAPDARLLASLLLGLHGRVQARSVQWAPWLAVLTPYPVRLWSSSTLRTR